MLGMLEGFFAGVHGVSFDLVDPGLSLIGPVFCDIAKRCRNCRNVLTKGRDFSIEILCRICSWIDLGRTGCTSGSCHDASPLSGWSQALTAGTKRGSGQYARNP